MYGSWYTAGSVTALPVKHGAHSSLRRNLASRLYKYMTHTDTLLVHVLDNARGGLRLAVSTLQRIQTGEQADTVVMIAVMATIREDFKAYAAAISVERESVDSHPARHSLR